MGAFQEERQVLIASPFCKFAHGIESVPRIPYYVEMATRNAIYGRPGATYLDVPRRHHHRQMRVPLCHLDIVGDALDALDAVREFAERRGDQHFF